MHYLSELSLVPVINFHPYNLGNSDYPIWKDLPNSMDFKHDYWVAQMKQWGFENLAPIRKGMEYVPLSYLQETDIFNVFRWQLEDKSLASDDIAMFSPRLFHSLEGGIIMCSGEDILIVPQCCVSLRDHQEWLHLADTKKFRPIWIGHPWVYYKTNRKDIFISEYIEKDFDGNWKHHHPEAFNYCWGDCTIIRKEAINHSMVRFRIPKSVYYTAALQLQRDIECCKSKFIQVARSLNLDGPEAIAASLIHGRGEQSHSPGLADL